MSESAPEDLDALVIGTGQAGKPLAAALAEAGRRTAIVERDRVGGTCAVRGCTPTKTMIASGRVAYLARRAADYGVRTGEVSVDMRAVRRRKRDMVDSWSSGARRGMERHEGLELVMGEARFVGEREVEVHLAAGGTRRFRADQVFLNTGARPRVPDLPGLDSVPFLDSTSVMELDRVPGHMAVIGGGFVGLEFAQLFRRLGAEVTVIARGERLAPREDDDVSDALQDILEEDGIRILLGTSASSVGAEANGGVRVETASEEGSGQVSATHLLVAVGREPNTEALELPATGLSADRRGLVPVNERLETKVDGIWALGDVAGSPPFTHMAYDDYRIVRANLLGDGGRSTADRVPTYTLFTDPELGRVGPTEREAREEGRAVRVATLPMNQVARAQEMDEARGFMKAVVDGETDRILGAAVLGIHGGEVTAVLQAAMMGGLPYTALRDGVFAHPTLAESMNNLFASL